MMFVSTFRNIAIHEYQEMDMSVLHEIAKNGWRSLVIFACDLGINLHP